MRPTEHRTLHYDFSHLSGKREYTFHHGALAVPLRRHTAATLTAARKAVPLLRLVPDRHLTHFVEADLFTDAIGMNSVTIRKRLGSRQIDHVVHMAVNVPTAGREAGRARLLRRWRKESGRGTPFGRAKPAVHPKLAQYDVTPQRVRQVLGNSALPEFPDHIYDINDAIDAATALLYHHSDLVNLNTDDGGSIPAIIIEDCITPAVSSTMELPLEILDEGDAWMITTQIDGSNALSSTPSPDVQDMTTGPLQAALISAQNHPDLEGQQWSYEYGTTASDYDSTSGSVPPADLLRSDAGSWAARNLTPSNGLSIDAGSVSYTEPPTTTVWTGKGTWSSNDAVPLPSQTIASLLAQGQVSLVVSSADHPTGLLTGTPDAAGADPDTAMQQYTVALTGPDTAVTGSATCTLNTGASGLSYDIRIDLGSKSTTLAAGFTYPDKSQPTGLVTAPIALTDATGYGTLSFECTNKWLRHLSVGVQYLGPGGTVLSPPAGWNDQIPEYLRGAFEPDPNTPFLALLQPVTTVFGVPIPNKPVRLSVPVWDDVAAVRFRCGGLGTGTYDTAVCPIGLTVTCLAELALPVFLMWASAAVMETDTVKSIMADKEVLFAVCTAGAFLVSGPTAAYIGTSQDPGAAAAGLAEKFGPLLLDPATSLGKWVLAQLLGAAAEDAIPFIDTALAVLNKAVTAAQLAETTAEVLQSPFVYETDLVRSVELDVTLKPDPGYNKFPDYHDHYTVTVSYDVGTTLPVVTNYLDDDHPVSDAIVVKFPAVPSGGNLKVLVVFYAEDGWQSGQGQTDWIDSVVEKGQLSVEVVVTTNEPTLNDQSVYLHKCKIGQLSSGDLGWLDYPGKPPTATVTTPSPYASKGKALVQWADLTVAQSPEMIGYCWQATGLSVPPDQPDRPVSNDALWMLQNLSVLEHPQAGLSYPKVGFTGQPLMAYDLASSDDGKGANFFVDPTRGAFDPKSNPAGGYHLRRLTLSHAGPGPVFGVGSNQSYGRFPLPMDHCVYHSQGFVFGINSATHKIFKLDVLDSYVADQDAPMATQAAGKGTRDGLIYQPVAIAAALDGRVLVLEAGNQRVQAFDTCGKPVKYFADPDNPGDPNAKIATMALVKRSQTHLLDLATEAQGYLYVLSYTGDGSKPTQYQMDLYNPDGSLLVSTPKVPAARMTVDILRSMYTLNFEVIVDAYGRPQPSVSQWLPPAPPPGLSGRKPRRGRR
ncbi:hypothetical protein [Streptomyces sp. NBC_01304]|uniref:hypothetical protein n=1 Tax=Streptomyces sp. NBC_01304 TaxID=2903818 RepID=UPI002E152B47|nr:hypothetical protein OG430_03225 [Streptomyces sp. NBC_01304]